MERASIEENGVEELITNLKDSVKDMI